MRTGATLWPLALVMAVLVGAPGLSRSDAPAGHGHADRGRGCDRTCPMSPAADDAVAVQRIMASGPAYAIAVETRDRNGVLVHSAEGTLVWGERHHIGGTDLRDLGFDRPDYEVNASLISPRKIWTSL
jgi:hypothetical protein